MMKAVPLLLALIAAPAQAEPAPPDCPAAGAPAAKTAPIRTSASQSGQTLRQAAPRCDHAISTKGTGAAGRAAPAGGGDQDCDGTADPDSAAKLKDPGPPKGGYVKTGTQNGQVLREAAPAAPPPAGKYSAPVNITATYRAAPCPAGDGAAPCPAPAAAPPEAKAAAGGSHTRFDPLMLDRAAQEAAACKRPGG